MTTPLSKMVALLVPSPLTPRRGQGSAGSLSEVKKGVAWSWHGRVAQICARGSMENNFLGANLIKDGLRRPLISRPCHLSPISTSDYVKDDCAFRFLHQENPKIFVLCMP